MTSPEPRPLGSPLDGPAVDGWGTPDGWEELDGWVAAERTAAHPLSARAWVDRSRPAAETFASALWEVVQGHLCPPARRVVTMRLGLDGMPARTFREIADALDRAPGGPSALFRSALRMIRTVSPDTNAAGASDADADADADAGSAGATPTTPTTPTTPAAPTGATGVRDSPGMAPDAYVAVPAEVTALERACAVLRLIATEAVGNPADPAMPYRLRMFVEAAFPCAPVAVAADVVLRLGYVDLQELARPLARAVARAEWSHIR
jgi:hypothetical protein